MSWDAEQVLYIVDRIGYPATLWLLVIAEHPRVSNHKSLHYGAFPGKIKSYAKEHDVDPPEDDEIREGYRRLTRVEIPDLEGNTDTINLGDKPDLVKLTDHGQTVKTVLQNQPGILRQVKEYYGLVEKEQEPWWPEQYNPEDTAINLCAISERPDDDTDEFSIDAIAEFPCNQCGSEIQHSYTFTYPTDAWSEYVSVECSECGQEWRHFYGSLYDVPEPIEPE